MIDIEDFYNKLEIRKKNKLQKEYDSIEIKIRNLNDKIKLLEEQSSKIYRKKSDLYYKVRNRVQNKCKHDIYGPYECMRDDCSGGHYRCKVCGKTEFSYFGKEKK